MRKKILIAISIFFVIIILAFVGLMFLTQTQYFRNFAKSTAESIVSSTTGQTFKIGDLEGNFFQNITLSDVSFVIEGENFVSVKEITINYAFFQMLNSTNLFSKVVPVDDLLIKGLDVNLIKYADGTWNFEKIGSNEEKPDDDQNKTPPAWSIKLSQFLLTQAQITTDDRAENKVSKYEIPEVDLSIKLIDIYRAIDLNLKNAAFNAPDQNLSISGLSTKAYYSEDKINIKDLSVLFNNAEINLNADAENLQDKPKFSLNASIKNYVIENIGTINLEAKGSGECISSNDIRANATIILPESEILQKKISGTLAEITMAGTTININGGNFNSDLGKIALGGDINLNRIITKEGNNNFDITLNLDDIKTTEIFSLIESATDNVSSLPIDTKLGAVLNSEINASGSWEEFSDLGVKADLKKFEIKGEQAGDLQLSGTADYTSSSAGVDISLSLDKVDLGSILADLNYSSEITSKFDVKAQIPLQGNFLETLTAEINGSFEPSNLLGIKLTDGSVDVSYENQILDIKSLELIAEKNRLVASGKSPEPLGADFKYDIEVENLNFISAISSDLAENPELKANLNVEMLKINKKEIREINLDVASEGTAINADLNIIEDDQFKYEMIGSLLDLSSTQRDIEISQLKLELEDTILDNRDNILLTLAPSGIVLQNFNLYHNNSSALANANISGSKIDGNVKISNLSLDDITKALEFQTPMQGTINSNIDLQGTKQNPTINAMIQTQNLQYNDFKNDNILLNLNYLNQNMDLNFFISNESEDILTAKGNSNINLNLDDIGKSIENAEINMSINSNDLNISPLSSLIEDIVKSEGALDINLTASGKLKAPTVNGKIELQEAKLQTKTIRNEIGIPTALIELNGQKAVLKTLELTTSNGSASFQGEVDIPTMSYALDGNLDNLLIKPERISAALTGDLSVKGEGEKVDISGKITVEKARITIPDSEPKELPEIQYVDDQADEFVVNSGNEESFFDQNIALNMQVLMKRNNWVRGQGANVELRGDLDIKKDFDQPIRIIGNIGVIRGTYENFGKVFRIQEGGTVSFSGREEIDPFLDITAAYRVSDINIYVNIGGQASKPKIDLTSDPSMSDTDIVSYLVFGASSNDISSGQRSAAGGIASGLAGGLAAAQLERLMGNAVSLDVVSISGTNVEVGKYLTEDLYIAYERGTTDSIIDSTNITYNKVIVEYHIFNNITIDADVGGENPGADLFYNFNF
jgi:autotransporter translocation and assembly factor TamB